MLVELAAQLATRGHEITCRWWTKSFHETNAVANHDFYGKPTIRAVGLRNYLKIDQADRCNGSQMDDVSVYR
jgi:hypothetical protein